MVERDWSSELTAYIDGELNTDDVRALEAALERDPALRQLERRLRSAVSAVEALPAPAPASVRLRANVLAAVAEPAPSFFERLTSWFNAGRMVPIGVAAAAAATAVIVWPRHRDEFDDEQLLLSTHLDVVENLDLVGVGSADDLEVIASLHELESSR